MLQSRVVVFTLGQAYHLEVCRENHKVEGLATLKGISFQSLNIHMSKMDLSEDMYMMRTQVFS